MRSHPGRRPAADRYRRRFRPGKQHHPHAQTPAADLRQLRPYLFYWFYLTWRQYRDHTGDTAYPVWHALTLAADYGKAMELRPDFWGRPFLDYKPGSGWDGDEPAEMTWVRFTASQSLRAHRSLDRLAAAPESN